jgi:hypothetical protein
LAKYRLRPSNIPQRRIFVNGGDDQILEDQTALYGVHAGSHEIRVEHSATAA